MDDYNAPTRVMPAHEALQPPAAPPSDHRFQVVARAVTADYELLGEICELGEGAKSGIAYLAMRRTSGRLDALRLISAADIVEVIGRVGEVLPAGDVCPKCGAQLRSGIRFCGNCRANLATLKLTESVTSPSIAEWLELKAEAGRNGYEILGHADAKQLRADSKFDPAVDVFVGRLAGTSKIVGLALERGGEGMPAVLTLDQTRILPKLMGALVEGPEPDVPKAAEPPPVVRPVVPEPAPPPPQPIPQPAPIPTPVAAPQRTPLWVLLVAGALSAAAVIAAVAFLVSTISRKGDDRAAIAAAEAARLDSIRRDSIRTDSIRADSIRAAAAADSATIRIGGSLPAGASITVDNQPVSGSSVRVAAGSHQVSASARGYKTTTETLELQPGRQTVWTPRLEQEVVAPKVATSCSEAARRSEWSLAFRLCSREAGGARSNGSAERTLASLYERGLGVGRDMDEAVQWYSESARRGDPIGQFRWADALDHGRVVRVDRPEAAKWYLKSAEQGNAEAQVGLGLLYAKGDGVKKSDTDAIKWFKLAAANGNARAKQELSARGVKP